MELIKEIYPGNHEEKRQSYKIRRAARAVVTNDKGEIALLLVGKYHMHKLPGGGIDPGESIMEALEREVMEETGCEVKVTDEVGLIIEYRDEFEFLQLSYCYLAELTKKVCGPEFSDKEIAEDFSLEWMPLEKAVNTIENEHPTGPRSIFIHERDLLFIEKARELLEKKHG